MFEATSRAVTFLFTDIEGSTQLWERFPEPMRAALSRHDAILHSAIENHAGRVIKTTGDGLHAVFDTASDGVAAVVAAQRALAAQPWDSTGPLKVRMALHTGEAEARQGDYYGPNVNRAARLMAVGAGGQILLSAVTAALVDGQLPAGFDLRDLGEHRLKDLIRPEHVFQVLGPGLPSDFPPLASLNAFPNNLPVQLTTFVGRERELVEAKRLLLATRLLSLTGSGGTGKTRLALQLAAECLPAFADGVWFVELAPLADPSLVLQSLAVVLGVRAQLGGTLLETTLNYLRAKQLLVLFDNCEHLVAACAQLAEHCLHACPNVKLLISSREPLGIPGETILRVPSLSLPEPEPASLASVARYESAQLFLERARAANPRLALTDKTAASVAQICRRLDGIPLALELAAARVAIFSVDQIAARLDDRFKLLTGGSRTALPRQQTLRAMIDWSYDLLSEPERVLLRRLAVFTGWTFEAAEAINAELDVLNLLTQLVNKSLVIVDDGGIDDGSIDDEGPETRYRLLETLRQYARDKLIAAGEYDPLRQRHLDYFVTWAEQNAPKVDSAPALEWFPRLERDYDNFRAALEWGLEQDVEAALRLVSALTGLWFWRGRAVEGIHWTTEALARAERLPRLAGEAGLRQTRLEANAWQAKAALAYFNDNPAALQASQAASRLARTLHDDRMLVIELAVSGVVQTMLGDPAGALAALEESLSLARQGNDPYSLGVSLSIMAQYQSRVNNDFETAATYEAEALRLLSANPASWGATNARFAASLNAILRGDYPRARALLLESLPIYEQIGDTHRMTMIASELAHIQRYEQHYPEAEAAYRGTIRGWQKLGHRSAVAHQLESFAFVARAQDQAERAARLFGAAASLRARIGVPMSPQEQIEYERELAAVKDRLGPQAFAAHWAAGQALSMEAAIDYAVSPASSAA